MSQGASGIFKGRISEAIVEAVLSEFGYKVDRVDSKFHTPGDKYPSPQKQYTPDLLVTDPNSDASTYVEAQLTCPPDISPL